MKRIIEFFKPNIKTGYLQELFIKYFIYQALVGFIIIAFVFVFNLISKNDNYLVSAISEVGLAVILLVFLFVLKKKGLKVAGNIFYVSMVVVILITMNILSEDIPVIYKYLHGYYTVLSFLVAGVLIGTRIFIIINAFLILMSTTHIYWYAMKISPEYSDYFTSGYIYHTISLVIITVSLFFIKKFTELAINRLNNKATIIEKQNILLSESEEKLLESNNTKDRFFSIIAHDLKGPIGSLLGISDLMTKNFDLYDDAKKKDLIGYMHQNTQNTYNLLDTLLLWSRSQEGAIDFNIEKENLRLLVDETFKLLNHKLIKKNITISNRISSSQYVFADKNMLLTVFRNLISNSIKFTPEYGKIEISAENIASSSMNNFIEISVIDNGVGILKENQKFLFDITNKISTKGTWGEMGTGLGLSLCREFIEKHGGKIWVESEINKGCTFKFTLLN